MQNKHVSGKSKRRQAIKERRQMATWEEVMEVAKGIQMGLSMYIEIPKALQIDGIKTNLADAKFVTDNLNLLLKDITKIQSDLNATLLRHQHLKGSVKEIELQMFLDIMGRYDSMRMEHAANIVPVADVLRSAIIDAEKTFMEKINATATANNDGGESVKVAMAPEDLQ